VILNVQALHFNATPPLRFISTHPILQWVRCWNEDRFEEVHAMLKLRTALTAAVPLVALSLAPVGSALAHGHGSGHGYGHGHGFGRGAGPIGAVVGLAAAIVTAPLWIIAAAAQSEPPAPAYYPQQAYYAPPAGAAYPPVAYYPPAYPRDYAPPAYAPPPPTYNYGPPPGYYPPPPPPAYYPAPQGYYPQQ
jgi:hypothetical protein